MQKVYKNMKTSLSANIQDTRFTLVKEIMEFHFKWRLFSSLKHADIIWADHPLSKGAYLTLKDTQTINQLRKIDRICSKANIAYRLSKLKPQYPSEFRFFPLTFLIPSHLQQLSQYLEQSRWVIVQSLSHRAFITSEIASVPPHEYLLVQQYVDQPYLLNGYKFEIRVYAAITKLKPLTIHLFNQGLVRIASEPYEGVNRDNCRNYNIHTAKHSKLKYSKNVHDNLIGHKRKLSSVFSHLENQGCDVQLIEGAIQDSIIKTVCCIHPQMAYYNRGLKSKFVQIIGFDFVIDSESSPWLVGIKSCPSFTCSSPIDYEVKKQLILHTLKMMKGNKDKARSSPLRKYYQDFNGFTQIYPVGSHDNYVAFRRTAKKIWASEQTSVPKMPKINHPVKTNLYRKPFIKTNRTTKTPDLKFKNKLERHSFVEDNFTFKSQKNDIDSSRDYEEDTARRNVSLNASNKRKKKKRTLRRLKNRLFNIP